MAATQHAAPTRPWPRWGLRTPLAHATPHLGVGGAAIAQPRQATGESRGEIR